MNKKLMITTAAMLLALTSIAGCQINSGGGKSLLFHFHQEALQLLFAFCHKGGVISISEVIDISPGSLDSSSCFTQPSSSHDVLCI